MSNLTPEMREKVLACKTPEEILALAKEAGRELTEEELEAVAGGGEGWTSIVQCPLCLGLNTEKRTSILGNSFYECLDCGHKFTVD